MDRKELLGEVCHSYKLHLSQHCGAPLLIFSRALDVTMPGFKSSPTGVVGGERVEKNEVGEIVRA